MKHTLVATTVAALAASTAAGQQPARAPQPAQVQVPAVKPGAAVAAVAPAPTLTAQNVRLISGINVGPTIIGAPYSAEAVTESVQMLTDGNRIVQRSSTKQYRDREGRERRETGGLVMITDPVAKVSYTLRPDTKTAEKMPFSQPGGVVSIGNPLGYTYGTPALHTIRINGPVWTDAALGNYSTASAPVEVLGTRDMEGVPASGTRQTSVIPAGSIGNERDINIVDERWVSTDLQLTVMTRHADPREGETTYKLTNIQRDDQDKSLFEVPADYKVTETGAAPVVFGRYNTGSFDSTSSTTIDGNNVIIRRQGKQ